MIELRKTFAGGLTAAACVFGLAMPADAAARGPQRHDRRPVASGQDAPVYRGRKTGDHAKLDRKLNERARTGGVGRSRAIIVLKPSCSIDGELARVGGRKGQRLGIVSGQLVELPNGVLRRLADNPCVASIHWDRKIGREMNRAGVSLGAKAVRQQLGFDGAGVGVAVIDSGVSAWHDDLTYHGSNPLVPEVGNQRVVGFVDFVNGLTNKYDDNGHGSHVAGIIAGNGWDTLGSRAGIAPAAHVVSLKVLDAQGSGFISNVIAALDWVVANRTTHNIRVVNLSVGAAVTESYLTDPLTLAAKRAVDAGVVVVTAAGNLGWRNGQKVYGGITAPGNAPWVLTVGANSHQGTPTRIDDVMASYSSHGPTAHDFSAKPDVVAPGTGIVSLSVPGSRLYTLHPAYLLSGSLLPGSKPYLSLTGTSMAAPMVAGTVALMMQANPNLTPNLAKAIIQYTAQDYGYQAIEQGAGFLNTEGAVKLAAYLNTAQPGSVYPYNAVWSQTLIWGNQKLKGGVITPGSNAYGLNIVWGTAFQDNGSGGFDNIVWGTLCPDQNCQNTVWATADAGGDIVWGSESNPTCPPDPLPGDPCNIVWGTELDENPDCNPAQPCNIVWGTTGAEGNVVWGTACDGQDCVPVCDPANPSEFCNIVWGTGVCNGEDCPPGCEPGEFCNIVWGTGVCNGEDCPPDCEPGEFCNIVWGTSDVIDDAPLYDDPDSPTAFDDVPFESLFGDLFFPPPAEQNPLPPAGEGTTPGGGIL